MSTAEERAMRLVREVAELPDRTSPADQPDMLLVTVAELAALAEGLVADDRHEQAEVHDRRVTELLHANNREVEQRRAAEAEATRLEALVYVPGAWKCPKCQCSLVSTFLDAGSGRIAANKDPQRCPNDCGPMWRVTERDAGNRLIDDMEREVERRREAEAVVEQARRLWDPDDLGLLAVLPHLRRAVNDYDTRVDAPVDRQGGPHE